MKGIHVAISLFCLVLVFLTGKGQTPKVKIFTKADTLRGSITTERAWWDVLRYDITVKPDYNDKTIAGINNITYKVVSDNNGRMMQIDLQEPLVIDSILFNNSTKVDFIKEGNVWHTKVPRQKAATRHSLAIFYHGKVQEAVRPPWTAGWTFTKDSLGRPWMTVTCQGSGASIWFPCKDHQSDEAKRYSLITCSVKRLLMPIMRAYEEASGTTGL